MWTLWKRTKAFYGQNIEFAYIRYVACMNARRNKSISKHVRYKLKMSDETKRCPTQVKHVR